MTERHHCGRHNLLHDGPECPRCEPIHLEMTPLPDPNAGPRLPVVIIPQFPTEAGGVRRELDLTDAERYGRLVEALGPSAKPWDPDAVEELDQFLASTSADDWLLAIGNPTMIALAAAALGSLHGGVNILQWQSRARRYEAVRVVFTEEGTEVEQATCLPGAAEE